MLTTVHLTTSLTYQQSAIETHSQIIIKTFIESCKSLDASIFEPLMEEDNVFENKEKYTFLADLKILFENFKINTPNFSNVVVNDGTCKACSFGKVVKIFSVSDSKSLGFNDRFAFVIEEEGRILKDIYRCNYF